VSKAGRASQLYKVVPPAPESLQAELHCAISRAEAAIGQTVNHYTRNSISPKEHDGQNMPFSSAAQVDGIACSLSAFGDLHSEYSMLHCVESSDRPGQKRSDPSELSRCKSGSQDCTVTARDLWKYRSIDTRDQADRNPPTRQRRFSRKMFCHCCSAPGQFLCA
jgi:hypothetical protein